MLKILTTHALVCDECDAFVVPSGRQNPSKRVDQTILSDAVHATREAEAAGWEIGIPNGVDAWIDLCPVDAEKRREAERAKAKAKEQDADPAPAAEDGGLW